ncbi:MAG: hypothetical protein ACFHVJ_14335 [Aestuariibacter sp.]
MRLKFTTYRARGALITMLALLVSGSCIADEKIPDTPQGTTVLDLIDDSGFETSFGGFSSNVADDVTTTENAIIGNQSLQVRLAGYRRVTHKKDYSWGKGPNAHSLSISAKVRVDETTSQTSKFNICAVAYVQNDSKRYSECEEAVAEVGNVYNVMKTLALNGKQVRRLRFELRHPGNNEIVVAVDDAHLFLATENQSEPDDPDSGVPGQPGDAPSNQPLPEVPEGAVLSDLIDDSGFESSAAGFYSKTTEDLSLTNNAIFEQQSLSVRLTDYRRIMKKVDYGWEEGPVAHSISVSTTVRVDDSTKENSRFDVCAVAYLQGDSTRFEQCQKLTATVGAEYEVFETLNLPDAQARRIRFELRHPGNEEINISIDDAHLYLVSQAQNEDPGNGDPGNGDPGNDDPGDDDPGDDEHDLSKVGFSKTPSKYRKISEEIDKSNDLSAYGSAANNVAKTVAVDLLPSTDVIDNGSTLVSFGLPLAPGTLINSEQVKVFNDIGEEVPAYVSSLGKWQNMPSEELLCEGLKSEGNPGIRSVLVQLEVAFTSNEKRQFTVQLNNGARTQSLGQKQDIRTTYRKVEEGTYDPEKNTTGLSIYEPAVLVAIDNHHLVCSGVLPMTTATGERDYMEDIDQATDDFFYSVVNQHKQEWPMTHEGDNIDFYSGTSTWLYGRPQTFYAGYIRTGNTDFLREAHRATDHYSHNIYEPKDCKGTTYPYCVGMFKMKNPNPSTPYPDAKYSNARPFYTYYLLTGDETHLDKIGYIAYGSEFHVNLEGNSQTARHRAYALDAHNVDYALTGNSHQLGKTDSAITAMVTGQQSGIDGYGPNGCFNYSPEGGDIPSFSPWMLNLLTNVMVNTLQETGNMSIPQSLVDVAQCEIDRAIVTLQEGENGPMSQGRYYPFYIARSYGPKEDLDGNNPYNGFEHAIDVATAVALGAYFSVDGQQKNELTRIAKELLLTHSENIEYWTRGTQGRAKYRVNPGRKYAWQYKHAGKLGWALGDVSGLSGKSRY